MAGGGGSYVPETPEEQAQARVAMQQWQDYQRRWLPVQEYFIRRTYAGEGARRALVEGGANTDVQARFGDAAAGLQRTLGARGLLAGSGADIAAQTNLAGGRGYALGLTRTNADDAAERQYQLGLADIINMGRGQKAASNQALDELSGLSGRYAASEAALAEQNAAGLGEAVGTGAGIGGSYGLSQIMAQKNAPTSNPTTGTLQGNNAYGLAQTVPIGLSGYAPGQIANLEGGTGVPLNIEGGTSPILQIGD